MQRPMVSSAGLWPGHVQLAVPVLLHLHRQVHASLEERLLLHAEVRGGGARHLEVAAQGAELAAQAGQLVFLGRRVRPAELQILHELHAASGGLGSTKGKARRRRQEQEARGALGVLPAEPRSPLMFCIVLGCALADWKRGLWNTNEFAAVQLRPHVPSSRIIDRIETDYTRVSIKSVPPKMQFWNLTLASDPMNGCREEN
eukprot:scaffold2679_cov251-Pinguiococcus_pyrenoidosus.AAC.17